MEISKTKSIADLIKASLISAHVQSLVLDSFKRASVRYPYLQASICEEHVITFEEQKHHLLQCMVSFCIDPFGME